MLLVGNWNILKLRRVRQSLQLERGSVEMFMCHFNHAQNSWNHANVQIEYRSSSQKWKVLSWPFIASKCLFGFIIQCGWWLSREKEGIFTLLHMILGSQLPLFPCNKGMVTNPIVALYTLAHMICQTIRSIFQRPHDIIRLPPSLILRRGPQIWWCLVFQNSISGSNHFEHCRGYYAYVHIIYNIICIWYVYIYIICLFILYTYQIYPQFYWKLWSS